MQEPDEKVGPDDDPAGSDQDEGRRVPWHLVPVWAGAAGAAGLLVFLLLLVPDVRAWLRWSVAYPVVARALGRDAITVSGIRVEVGPEPGVTAAFAVMVVLFVLAMRVFLAARPTARWSKRVRIDTPFILALVPYMALAPLLATLAAAQLFRFPWAFFAVSPLIVLLMVAFVIASLVFAFWIEAGGREKGPRRFLASVLLFLAVGLFWIVFMDGTTTRLRWWIAVVAVALVVVVQYSVTLGNRIHSHRRALFSLGCFHLAFFTGFLLLWFLQGPWPVQDGWFAGNEAVRALRPSSDGALLLVLAVGPPALIAVGAYTVGAFLHRYAVWARVWVDGLSVLALFAQVLEGWVVLLMVGDPYDAAGQTMGAPGPLSVWVVAQIGGWGYFWAKFAVAVALVLLLSLPDSLRAGRWAEVRTVLLGAILGFGLVAGLRHAFLLAAGV